jgi:hypothetical protein
MVKFDFKDISELMDFLNYVEEFNSWETVTFKMIASNGMQLNTNTQIMDPLGLKKYVEFKKMKPMIKNFIDSNGYLPIILELKLQCPSVLKNQMDPAKEYENLFLNFYSNNVSTYCNISFVESGTNLSTGPITAWAIYITNFVTEWKQKTGS